MEGSRAATRSQGSTRATPAPPVGGTLASSAVYRRAQQSIPLRRLASSSSLALRYGAFIIPVDGANPFGPHGLTLGAPGIEGLSLLGLPDFLRQARANPERRAETGLPDLLDVLGQRGTIGELIDGGALTFGQLPLIALALVLLSSLLVVGAVLPPGLVARTPVAPARYEALREPLALAAIGILVPVAIVALAVALA
jgi:hypothetical protein